MDEVLTRDSMCRHGWECRCWGEVSTFAESVSGAAVHFIAMSHPELWTEWETLEKPAWLGKHVARLRARYELTI